MAHWNWSAGQGESQVEPRGQQAARVVVVGLMIQLEVGVSVWGEWGGGGRVEDQWGERGSVNVNILGVVGAASG